MTIFIYILIAIIGFVLGIVCCFTYAILAFCGEIEIDKSGERDIYRLSMKRLPGDMKYSFFRNVETRLEGNEFKIPQ